ncbi:hypothetical protein [Halospeciosus flavus]|uniref:hypothetical protein n=1 Tax=Halospeciosus flavus TaxID=3032283 RepID=UPI00360A4F9F
MSNPVKRWVLLTGSRAAIATIVTGGAAVVTGVLVTVGVIYLGPGSTLATELASGLLSGLLSLVTVALSINQLILSRVFGTPSDLTDRLEGSLDFRRTVEDVADVDTSPNDPGAFLGLVAESLEERTATLEREVADAAVDVDTDVDAFTSDLVAYADHLSDAEGSNSTFDVLFVTLGTEYADYLDTARAIQNAHGDALPAGATVALDDVLELLKAVATVRQFFKTLAIQQDLARLSRRLVYTGLAAVLVTYWFGQVYVPGASATVPAAWLPGSPPR